MEEENSMSLRKLNGQEKEESYDRNLNLELKMHTKELLEVNNNSQMK
jgi:hypothetical protein